MKIKMRTLDAGPDGVRRPGEVHDLPTAEAEQLIAGGYAVKVERVEKVQEPVKGKPRTATRTPGRKATKPEADEADEPADGEDGEE